jgi:ribosomal protein S18 acetylase RimI-like enzyme
VSPESLTVVSEPHATPEEIGFVRAGLHRFNLDATGLTQHHEVTLFVRDAAGAIKGGLLGYVWGEWLHITDIWIADECRRLGLGSRLLERAEREAAELGARGAFLSTFDFQAPEFYRGRGYEIYAALTAYPPGHTDYHLRKVFKAPEASPSNG